MFRALGFSRGSANEPPCRTSSSTSVNLLEDATAIEQALHAMDLLMDDRVAEAQAIIDKNNTTFFKLTKGVISFIEATLGFEPDAIKKASNDLYQTEEAALADRNRAIKSGIKSSSHFPPGLEYSVVYAEAQLLGAITLLLSESMLDTAKALLKLRKAYQTFNDVYSQMKTAKSMSGFGNMPMASISTPILASSTLKKKTSTASMSTASSASISIKKNLRKYKPEFDADKDDGILTPESLQNPEIAERLRLFHRARMDRYQLLDGTSEKTQHDIDEAFANMDLRASNGKRAGEEAVDEYIVSAVNACYGILQLTISILPPSISRILSVVGFHCSRNDGIELLWHSVENLNIHGAIGLLVLLQYFDGPTQVTDIQLPRKSDSAEINNNDPLPENDDILMSPSPDPDDPAATKYRLRVALRRASRHFSHGALWQLQEGRMEASRGNIREAIKIMDDTSRGPINMRQLEGLMLFDKTMFIVTLHGYEQASKNFIRLIDLNSWSHMLYRYFSAMCHVEMYRQKKLSNPQQADQHKQLAAEGLEEVPSFLGKRKFMAKAMPFDLYVLRKLNQWKVNADELGCNIVDAISVSPIHEVIYFWNGFGRMLPDDLEAAMQQLSYSGEPGSPFALDSAEDSKLTDRCPEVKEDSFTRYLLQSVVLRNQGKVQEGYDLLKTHVLSKVCYETPNNGHYPSGLSKVTFYKKPRDPWVPPSAAYEAAIFEWTLAGTANVARVRDYLDMASSYGDDYELSTRVGLRIKGALSKLQDL